MDILPPLGDWSNLPRYRDGHLPIYQPDQPLTLSAEMWLIMLPRHPDRATDALRRQHRRRMMLARMEGAQDD